jgi:hypothetical protein
MEMPGDASMDEVNNKVDRVLTRMESLQQEVQRNHQEIKQSSATSRSGINISSWAKIAALPTADVVPPSLTRVHSNGTTSTPGASPRDLNKDCEIIIKMGDPNIIKSFRGKQPSEIRKAFNHQCQKAAREGAKALLAIHAFTAQQLKSGDIAIRTRTAAEAEIARNHKDKWISRFGRSAKLQAYTYGVLVHGVPFESLKSLGGVELRDQKAIIDMLRSHNDYRWGEMAEITRVS